MRIGRGASAAAERTISQRKKRLAGGILLRASGPGGDDGVYEIESGGESGGIEQRDGKSPISLRNIRNQISAIRKRKEEEL